MNHLDLDYNIYDPEELTKMVIYKNATFDIKKVLSDKTSPWCSAMTVITPTQAVSFPFNYDRVEKTFLQHASITDVLLSRIYPDYERTYIRDDQEIYDKEATDTIYVLTIDSRLVICIQPNGKINQKQYDELQKMINEVKHSEYFTKKQKDGTEKFEEFWFNNHVVSKDDVDSIMEKLKSHITDLPLPDQYNISNLEFPENATDDEIMEKSAEYAKNFFDKNNIISYDQPSIDDDGR